MRSEATTGGVTGAGVSSSAEDSEDNEVAATDLGSDPASEADVLLEDWDDPSPPEAREDNKDEPDEGDTAGDVPINGSDLPNHMSA